MPMTNVPLLPSPVHKIVTFENIPRSIANKKEWQQRTREKCTKVTDTCGHVIFPNYGKIKTQDLPDMILI